MATKKTATKAKAKTHTEEQQLQDAIESGNLAVLPPEELRTESGVSASTPARTTADLDPTWVCDLDGARLNVQRQAVFDDKPHEVRVCSADPQHLKIVQV